MEHRSAAEEVSSMAPPMSFTASIFTPRFKAHGCARRAGRWCLAESLVRSASWGSISVLDASPESQFVASAAGRGCTFAQRSWLRRREHQASAGCSNGARMRVARPKGDA
jgi:hypothetical protein